MTDLTVETIRAAHKAVTPGPWRWRGNVDVQNLYLSTVDRGRLYIMRFRRWGMRGAQPEFRIDRDENTGCEPATDRPIFEVAPSATSRDDERVYRGDVVGIRNPHADYLARSWEYVEHLLGEVDRLTALANEAADVIKAYEERDYDEGRPKPGAVRVQGGGSHD